MHPYSLQTAAFLFSMLFPGGVLALIVGAVLERARRRRGRPAPGPAQSALSSIRLAPLGD
ncbi:MAG TPA: hypothetical protein VNF68_04575 [Candidatus Baltobacteraceae bacterium]|nr:hypothetical protein [Candidatus Baltobacteraceae bacterium]